MNKKRNNVFIKLQIDRSEIINLALTSIQTNKELLLTYFNQHCFNKWSENEEYQNILENEFTYYLDGFGIWLALKIFSKNNIICFNASETNNEIFQRCIQEQIRIILVGGNFPQSILEKKELIIELYLNGYEDTRDLENIINKISMCKSRVIIIGMGVPLQEKLAYKISQKIPNLQIICVGNYLEFYFGTKKRAPLFLRDSGFEWLFRLFTEPKRLWKRYIFGIPLFFYRILRIYFQKNQSYEDVS